MTERRTNERTLLGYRFKVNEANSGLFLGEVIDMSVCGFMTKGDVNVEKGREYDVQIQLPKPLGGKTHISCRSIARRIASSKEGNQIGFEISAIESMDRKIVEHLVMQIARLAEAS